MPLQTPHNEVHGSQESRQCAPSHGAGNGVCRLHLVLPFNMGSPAQVTASIPDSLSSEKKGLSLRHNGTEKPTDLISCWPQNLGSDSSVPEG